MHCSVQRFFFRMPTALPVVEPERFFPFPICFACCKALFFPRFSGLCPFRPFLPPAAGLNAGVCRRHDSTFSFSLLPTPVQHRRRQAPAVFCRQEKRLRKLSGSFRRPHETGLAFSIGKPEKAGLHCRQCAARYFFRRRPARKGMDVPPPFFSPAIRYR